MKPDRVIYTDGRDVTVTDSTLKVKNTSYNLKGITNLGLWTIHPERWPGIVLMLLGITAAVLAYLRLLPNEFSVRTDTGTLPANTLWLWVGIFVAVIGLLMLLLGRDRYAVRIGTAEGEKNAVVSRKREYIAQIVDAMYSAFDGGTATPPMTTPHD